MGENFLADYARDGSHAWKNLMLAVIANLNTLASSELVVPLRDLINIAKDVEDQVRKGQTLESKGLDGDRRLPMDQIGAQWRVELPSVGSTTNATKMPSRQKVASSSKSKISSASPSSNAKTSSEMNGSEA